MKTPNSVTWIAPLMLLVAFPPVVPAQSQTKPSPTVKVETPPPTAAGLPAATQTRVLPSDLALSPWTVEIIKLAEAGIEDSVVLSFIDNSGTFNLGADQIIYLSDLGVPGYIVAAMLQHDSELASGVRLPTIASEAVVKLEWPKGFLAKNDVSSASRKTTAAVPASATVATSPVGRDSTGMSLLGVASSAPNFPSSTAKFDMAQSPAADQPSTPAKAASAYPIRESRPVELLPPILFINEVPRTPNTIVIVGFP